MSSSEPSFANFVQLNKERLLLYSISLFSPCKSWNSCNDLVLGSVKIKWGEKTKTSVSWRHYSRKWFRGGLWRVYRSKYVPATLELSAACLRLLVLWTERMAPHHILTEVQGSHGKISEIWGLVWRLVHMLHMISYISFASSHVKCF